MPKASRPRSIRGLHAFRNELRQVFLGQTHAASSGLQAHLRRLRIDPEDVIGGLRREPALGIITLSALSILSDPKEMGRIKTCPGRDCGWMFLDETKNARRKWCAMELCGNRAKASRNYERRVQARR
jgi:predicted RNA-binding Zn ribbon-like protein